MARSIIYRNITYYRATMQLLYGGKYYARFDPVKKIISDKKVKSITELCFGDTVIAEFCKKNEISWNGIDSNEKFVTRAIKKGFLARKEQITVETTIHSDDAILIMGSLYHFESNAESLIQYWLSKCNYLIISEPVRNLSGGEGKGKRLAARLSNAGNGPEYFRYNSDSLLNLANRVCANSKYKYYIATTNSKEIILVFEHS